MSSFDSSDDDNQQYDESEFQLDCQNNLLTSYLRLDLSTFGCTVDIALAGLPGCRFKDTWRKIDKDIESLKNAEITDIYVLCTKGELNKYRVPKLLEDITESGMNVHHYPFPDGQVPSMANLSKMLTEIKQGVDSEKKILIHCFGGLGRSCLVAVCLLMILDKELTSENAIQEIRKLRGPRAIQTVKQYNFVHEFREKYAEFEDTEQERSVSR